MVIAGFFFLCTLGLAQAHGSGASEEKVIDGYLVDVGLSAEMFTAGEAARFDFSLTDAISEDEMPFTDVWFRINKERKVFLATGIHVPNLGQTGISYVFPTAGEYEIHVRYQNDGEKIVEHSFMMTVADSIEEGAESPLSNVVVSVGFIVAFLLGWIIGFVVRKKKSI